MFKKKRENDKEEWQIAWASINQVARTNHRRSYMGALHWHAEAIPQLQPWGQGYFSMEGDNDNRKGGHVGCKWELG